MFMRSNPGKILIAFVCAAIFILSPSQSFAATQTEYRTEGGVKVGYQKISVDDTTFKDVNVNIGGELTKANENKLASAVMGQWSPVAVDIFDSDTANWGFRNAPTYINSMALAFDQSFKHTGNETDRKIDLKTWLADPEPRKIDTDSQMKSTGLKKAASISQLRVDMADHIVECLQDVYGKGKSAMTRDAILNAKYDKLPDHKALERFIDENDNRDVYYSMVTSINKSNELGVSCAYYNSYAIAIYDVTLSPVISESKEGLDYVSQEVTETTKASNIESYVAKVNDTGAALTTNIKQDNTINQTMSNSMAARESGAFTFGDPVGDNHWNELPFLETIGSKLLRSTDPVRAMNSSESDKNTNAEDKGVYKNVTMPVDTCLKANRATTRERTVARYKAPYAIEYKVALFSLNGEIAHPAKQEEMKHRNYGDYYALFDRNTAGAVENLKVRTSDKARNDSSYENNYGDTGGYVKDSKSVSAKIRWFDMTMGATGSGRFSESIMGRQKGNIENIVKTARMLTSGSGSMKLETEKIEGQLDDEFLPTKALTKVTTVWQHDTGRELLKIRLNKNRAWNLGAVALQAYNEADNPYYGFDGSAFGGDWVVCDENGTEIDPAQSPLSITDTRDPSKKTGTQILLTENEGTGYIRWKIKDDIQYENALDPVSVIGRDNTPSKQIEIEVLPEPQDNTDLILSTDGEVKVPAGDELDLNKHIVATLKSGDEEEVVPARFIVSGGGETTPEGIYRPRTPGRYSVKGFVMIDPTKVGIESKNEVTIIVTDRRSPNSIAVSEPPEGELSPVCSSVGYELLPLVSVLDNYGEPWDAAGTFDFNFSGGGKSITGASITDGAGGPQISITRPGTYQVVATYKEGNADLNTTITFKVHEIIGIPDPVPVKNLSYNGELQTGVVGVEGCALTDEKATEAGVYQAKATPAQGYSWLDGSTGEKKIPYRIHEAYIEKPKAKDLVYNGKTQTALAPGFGYTVDGGTAKDAGSYSAKAILLSSCRWEDKSRDDLALDYIVAKAPITIGAEDKSSITGEGLKALTYRVSGAYAEGDDLGIRLSTDADKDRAGTYAIKVAWNDNKNYEATLTDGKYTVTAASAPETPASKVSAKPAVKITTGKKSMTVGWNKIQGADGYDIFFARCNYHGKKLVCKNVSSIKGNNIFTWKKSGLKKGTAYKSYVKAYVYENGKKTYVWTSPIMHAYTGNGTKTYTNAKSVKVNKTKVTLKKGKTFKIKAKVTKVKKNKKLMPKGHAPTVRYMTSNRSVATVSGSGKITAKATGTCYIYVYAHNGVMKSVKVNVK